MTCRPLPLLAACFLLASLSARAATYEVELSVETEQDIYDLRQNDQISDETAETLIALLDQGVDLNSASRDELYSLPNITYEQVDAILLYRKNAGFIDDPAVLVSSGAIPKELLEQIAPFLIVGERGDRPPVSGTARAVSAYTHTDLTGPPAYLKVKLSGPLSLSGGFAMMTTRRRLGAVTYDPNRDALSATLPVYGLEIPKYYVQWRSSQRQLIAGTFVGGFAERLTLDNTTRERPSGFYADNVVEEDSGQYSTYCRESQGELSSHPCDDAGTRGVYGTPDFRWRDGFRGLAGSVEDLSIGETAKASFFAFGSYQTRSIYQYALYDFGRCEDPRNDEQDTCAAPQVFVRRGASDQPTSVHRNATLPSVIDEATGGGHATLHLSDLTSIGLTGYYSSPTFNVEGMRLDFQEWNVYPFQGPFGAIGVDGATRLGPVNASVEVARSLHSEPGTGGGFAAVQRNVINVAKKQEVTVSFRYFDRNFANPWSHAQSAADQFEGNRARNELGGRVEWVAKKIYDWRLRASADLWAWPQDGEEPGTAGRTSGELSGRADFDGWSFLHFSTSLTATNKDLAFNGPGLCYRDEPTGQLLDTEGDALGEAPRPCAGERYRIWARVEGHPFEKLFVPALAYSHEWMATPDLPDRMGVNQGVWLEAVSRPIEQLKLEGRVQYRNYEVPIGASSGSSVTVPPRYVGAMAQGTWLPSRRIHVSLRYDAFVPLDPAVPFQPVFTFHRFRLALESRF